MISKHRFLMALALALVVAVAGLAVAACGSGETSTTASPTTAVTSAAAPASPDTTTAATDTDTPTSGILTAKGLVDNPATWTSADVQAMNPVTVTVEHPKNGPTEYTGVKLSALFATLGLKASATTLVMGSADGFMAEAPLADIAASADAMLAIADDGTFNMVLPGMAPKAWARDVVSWEFK